MPNNGTRAAALAAQFRRNLSQVAPKTATVRLPIPDIAPDFVFEFVAKRVDIESMLYAGMLPERLALTLMAQRDEAGGDAEATAARMTAQEQLAMLDFQRRIACEVCVEPRLVFRAPENDGEIDLREIPYAGNLIVALFTYAMNLSPDVPVATATGETTVEAVESFRDEPALHDAGDNGKAVRPASKRPVSAA